MKYDKYMKLPEQYGKANVLVYVTFFEPKKRRVAMEFRFDGKALEQIKEGPWVLQKWFEKHAESRPLNIDGYDLI